MHATMPCSRILAACTCLIIALLISPQRPGYKDCAAAGLSRFPRRPDHSSISE
ncbi:hypothetical protein BDW75DRAFT_222447 [Aspergillus navahoensis]